MTDDDFKWHYEEIARIEAETIERCARVAESYNVSMTAQDIAAAIRALKDER